MNLDQIRFCAAECERQQSGEMSVYWMCQALDWLESTFHANSDTILKLGYMVEPHKNLGGYRHTPVTVNDKVIPHENIVHQIANLVRYYIEEVPTELYAQNFYQEFEEIHPFIDGNGRVGALLFNWLMGTLSCPVTPPKFTEVSNV